LGADILKRRALIRRASKGEFIMASSAEFLLGRRTATIIAFPVRKRATTPGHVYRVLRIISTWIERARQRRALADLDDRLLSDIGITRRQATGECDNPFWR
jgi:uncharacterized protein YjiS (DUF1127 family)